MDDPSFDITNRVDGDVSGTVIQAGRIDGGVHIHLPAARRTVALPHRSGGVPPLAAAFQPRTVTERLVAALREDPTVVVTSSPAIHTAVVAGLGGVGKTQVAADYAEHLWSAGHLDLLIWTNATSRGEIVASYSDVAADLVGVEDPDPERGARRLLEVLATLEARWLVVLDDLRNPADLHGLWPPRTSTGQTVVTTRRQDAALRGRGRTLIEVDVFTAGEAIAYLEDVLTDQPQLRPGAIDLTAALGRLPLALAQAAAYLLDRNLSCADYLTRWIDRRRTLFTLVPEPEGLPDEYRATIAVTWSLSIEQANRLEPVGVARPILELASFLDPNGTPTDLFAAPVSVAFVAHAVGRAVSAEDIHDGLGCLCRLSLITTVSGVRWREVRVHRLVERATRDAMPLDHFRVVARSAAVALLHVWPPTEREGGVGEALRANATALIDTGGEHLWSPDISGVWFRLGRSLGTAGLSIEARDYYARLREAARAHLGGDHRVTLATRGHFGRWQGESGDVAGAVGTLAQLLEDVMRVLGPEDADTLTTRANLAYYRGESGDTAAALAELKTVLDDRMRVLGADHPDVIIARSNLARMRGEAGDPVGAVEEFGSMLPDAVRILGLDHPHTLIARGNLAYYRRESGDIAGATADYEHLLVDTLRALGPDSLNALAIRSNLAALRGQSGDIEGAIAAYESLISDTERVLGRHNPHTLATREHLTDLQNRADDRSI